MTAHPVRWAVFGDSLTAINDTSSKFYHDYIKDKIGCIVDNYAYSGSGYSVAGSGVPFYTRVTQIKVSPPPDVVTIFGSFNDLNSDDCRWALLQMRILVQSAGV